MTTKNTAAKKTTKAAAKNNGKPAKAKKAAKPAAKAAVQHSDELRKPQIRILAALAKLKPNQTFNRSQVVEKCSVDVAYVVHHVGQLSADGMKRTQQRLGIIPLAARGYVKVQKLEVEEGRSEIVYQITAAGRKALEAEQKKAAAK